MVIHDYQGHSIDIPDAEYKQSQKKCEECKTRKWYAKFVDAHYDFINCPYDCKNDIEHYKLEHPERVKYE